jgi:hypothetical protein
MHEMIVITRYFTCHPFSGGYGVIERCPNNHRSSIFLLVLGCYSTLLDCGVPWWHWSRRSRILGSGRGATSWRDNDPDVGG